jgi:hypothetical protein
MLTAMTTVTLIPPGFTVSWQPTHAPTELPRAASAVTPLAALRVTVVLRPASSRPDEGATVTLPIRAPDSVMDQVTGPPEAVSVRVPPSSGLSTMVLGVTLSVPGAGGGGALVVPVAVGVGLPVALLEDGAGELGEGPWLVGEAEDEGPPAPDDVPPAGDVPPAAAEDDR